MSGRLVRLRHGLCAAALGCSVMVLGCSTSFPRNEPGAGLGEIYVGSPRVESSDRLINDRREKEHWLVLRRNEVRDAKLGFSGITSLTSMSFLGAQVNVGIDPARGLQNVEIGRRTQASQSLADDEKALSNLRASARDDIIAKYNKKEITFKQAEDQLKELGLTATPSSAAAPSATTPLGPASGPNSTLISKLDKDALTAPTEPPRATQLSATPIQDFQDRLAAYETIQSEIHATRGDDVHDLAGNTLYRLAFDTTVFPTDDTSAWALVTVKLDPRAGLVDYDKLLANSLQRHIAGLVQANERVYRIFMRTLAKDCWPAVSKAAVAGAPADESAVLARAFRCASSKLGSNLRAALERQVADLAGPIRRAGLDCGDSCTWLQARRAGIGELFIEQDDTPEARRKFSQWAVRVADIFDVHTLVEFQSSPAYSYASLVAAPAQPGHFPYRGVMRDGQTFCDNAACHQAAVARFKANLQANIKSSVYEVVPKESVQQLSEVSSNRKSAELLLGLAASKGDIGLNAAIQSIKSNTAQYDAIRRQPLVVAFTRRGNNCGGKTAACVEMPEFGWILGPSFVMSNDGKSTRFRHSASPKTVAASVSLPAWLETLGVEVTTKWVREADVQPIPSAATNTPVSYNVKLPATYGDVFAGLGDHIEREPRVDEFQYLEVAEDAPAAVIIRGRDLWRSTAVNIGSQRADLVTIHPDRRGVTANFDKIASPAGSALDNGRAKLTLQTSEGDVLAGFVAIISKTAPAKETAPMKITGLQPRIVAEVQQTIELNNALAATDEATIQVTSPQDAALNVTLSATTQVSTDRKNILFVLPEKSVPNLMSGDVIAVSLAVKHGKTGGTEVFDVRKSVVYYKKADELKAKITALAKLAPVLKFKMDLPLNTAQAFAAFAGGSAKVKATAALNGAKEPTVAMEGTCKIAAVKGRRKAGDRDSCALELQGTANWTAGVKEAVFTVSFVDKDAPELEGADKIKLTR